MKNGNLHRAKKEKNDEFYTQLVDIEKELSYYTDYFKGKVVYCNCDDYRISNFIVYFKENFEYLGLKRLISTNYGDAWHYEYDGDAETVEKMNGNGDFRSEECIEFLKECDVVVTNPPFSLFREYVAQLMEYDKKFIVIGNMNAITYKEIFPYIKNNQLWLGYRSLGSEFYFNITDDYKTRIVKEKKEGSGWKEINGIICGRVANACWFTNIEHNKRKEGIYLSETYSEEKYPKYDNYDAIEVSRVEKIPCDYDGVMGVPISFMDKFCPAQFEILGIANNVRYIGDYPCLTIIEGKPVYNRILIRKKVSA